MQRLNRRSLGSHWAETCAQQLMGTADMTRNKQSEDSPSHLQLIILTESLFKDRGELLVKFTPTTLCIMPPPAPRAGAALRRCGAATTTNPVGEQNLSQRCGGDWVWQAGLLCKRWQRLDAVLHLQSHYRRLFTGDAAKLQKSTEHL